ncbi:MAG: HAD-IC family P-type ATPase [Clostridia bacterium]|nr:HAD-IC family P-type ATPase [Clostridia bacterium]
MKKSPVNLQPTERFNPNFSSGLSDVQVNLRKSEGQINAVKKHYSKSYLSIFTGNIFTSFNLLGVICFFALFFSGASLNQFVFVFFYVANIAIGIFQEIRAKRCVDRLSLVAQKNVIVIRNGERVEISSDDIVLDEVIYLGMGSQIPADCVILEGEIEVNESLLTGEPIAIKKKVGSKIFAGSFITSGNCYAQAVKVGRDNYVQQLSAKARAYKKPKSEIMNSLSIIIRAIGFIILPIASALVIKSLLINPKEVASAVLGAVTVVLGMIPAGMFLLTSVALAVGIIKLAKHNTLVQDLYSLEMLARVDTICFDKTGTITDGNMTVDKIETFDNYTETAVKEIIGTMISALGDTNQTSNALKNYFSDEKVFNVKTLLPFNSTTKMSAVTFKNGNTFAFGAPEFVLGKDAFSEIEERVNEYASKGLRVLALCKSGTEIIDNRAPKDFMPIALITLLDNVREDAVDTVQWFKDNDVTIKVISGDNPITVSEVAKRAGIDGAENYISLEGLSDQEICDIADKYTVFGRVTPEQKAVLIRALKLAGHVTAMTGDGVNDILALKESDCAISVASGSDAARNVSHLVLLDNNFSSMPKIVYEGRRVINNVSRSASLFLMKTLFTMFMAVISLILPYMYSYPFIASQMNLLEFAVIGIPAFFLSFQKNDSRVEGKFIAYVIKRSLPSALLMLSSVATIELVKIFFGKFYDSTYTDIQIYSIIAMGLVNLFYVCRPFTDLSKKVFFVTTTVVATVIVLALFDIVPLINDFFGYKAIITTKHWYLTLILAGVVATHIPISIILQKAFFKINIDKLVEKITNHKRRKSITKLFKKKPKQ